jgi:AraC-like DNA-binding protein
MSKAESKAIHSEDVAWLAQVREVRKPLNQSHPIILRHSSITSGPPLPRPTIPYPEQHPCCEFNYCFLGKSTQFIGAESHKKDAGALMIMGPGIPHYALQESYPGRGVTIHFLPTLLFEMGPGGDGVLALSRFMGANRMNDWIVYPPPGVRKQLEGLFEQMIAEAAEVKIGSEFRLRALLMEALVVVMRWENAIKQRRNLHPSTLNWQQLEKALRFIYENYTQPIYIEEIAKAAGMHSNSLQLLFRETLGMSCVKYLRAYRIFEAAALLSGPEVRVTETALAVGFETLSHFNVSFRELMGRSPAAFVRSHKQPHVKSLKIKPKTGGPHGTMH